MRSIRWVVLSVALVVLAVVLYSVLSSKSDQEKPVSGTTDSRAKPTAALTASIQETDLNVRRDQGATYTLRLLMDEYPAPEQVRLIRAIVDFPEEFEVVGVTANKSNLPTSDAIFHNRTNGSVEFVIRHADNSAVTFNNTDASREWAAVEFRLKQDLTHTYKEAITLSQFEIEDKDNQAVSYNTDGASVNVQYTAPADAVGKLPPNGNPLVSHRFGADPYALVYGDRVYLYATNDVLEHDADGNVKDNTYASINTLSVISSDDLANWTDHGEIAVAGPNGAAKWATQSWAPAAAHKVIDGQDKFFLYFANNASGIGVLTSDSPTGPWVDPIGKALVTRATPGVEAVTWLFDPAVLVDDDGKAYLYFGGGVPEDKDAMPDTARVMELGPDMISVVGEAKTIPAPFMFEDAGINKVNGTYYFTYCSNFYEGERPEGSPPAGEIAYMTSDSPMGPWTYHGSILKNPGHFFGVGGNNHHVIFPFQGAWYIAYHAQTLSKAMGVPKGYRSTQLNQVTFAEDGSIREIQADYKGVPQIKPLNPYASVSAATIGWNAGIKTEKVVDEEGRQSAIVSGIDGGDWIALSQVDFGSKGASSFTASIAGASEPAYIDLRLDSRNGKSIGILEVAKTSGEEWNEIETKVAGADGIHDLYLVFGGQSGQNLFKLQSWKFTE